MTAPTPTHPRTHRNPMFASSDILEGSVTS
jgi:hypothetical protein